MTTSNPEISDAIRDRVALVRVLCIGFMIYVHVPDNAISALSRTDVPWVSWFMQGFIVEGVGRASAAVLSLVSGLLTAQALARSDYLSLYRRRFRSIVLPMLLWSSVTVALYALITLVRPTFLSLDGRSLPEAAGYYLNAVFFISAQPVGPTLHLGFLRDLFVCMLLAPWLMVAIRRLGVAVPLVLGALYLADAESVVMLRPLVLFAFSVGLWLSMQKARLDALDAAWPLWVLLSIVATLMAMYSATEGALQSSVSVAFADHGLDFRETVMYPLSRLFGGLALWTLAARLVGTRWNTRLARLSSYVFVAFCSHFLVLTVLWEALVRPLIGSSETGAYAVWFLLAPLFAMAAAVVMVELTVHVAPQLAALITGGRLVDSQAGTATMKPSILASDRRSPMVTSLANTLVADRPPTGVMHAAVLDGPPVNKPATERSRPLLAPRHPVSGDQGRVNLTERAEVSLETVTSGDR